MRRFHPSVELLPAGPGTLTDQAVLAPAAATDSKNAGELKEAEKPKAGEEVKGTEKAKEPEKPKGAEKTAAVEEAKKPPTPKPAKHTVQKEPLKIEVTLDGVFEAQEMSEVSLEPEVWTTLTVVSAGAAHAQAGDLLARWSGRRSTGDLRFPRARASDSRRVGWRLLTLKNTPMT
jgi:hypothetical protein